MTDIKFDIIKKIGVLSTTGKGWGKRTNLIVGTTKNRNTTCANGRQTGR